MIILAAKQHQASWYQNLHPDWAIGVSETGWTNDQLGKRWLELFNEHTKASTAGVYCYEGTLYYSVGGRDRTRGREK